MSLQLNRLSDPTYLDVIPNDIRYLVLLNLDVEKLFELYELSFFPNIFSRMRFWMDYFSYNPDAITKLQPAVAVFIISFIDRRGVPENEFLKWTKKLPTYRLSRNFFYILAKKGPNADINPSFIDQAFNISRFARDLPIKDDLIRMLVRIGVPHDPQKVEGELRRRKIMEGCNRFCQRPFQPSIIYDIRNETYSFSCDNPRHPYLGYKKTQSENKYCPCCYPIPQKQKTVTLDHK